MRKGGEAENESNVAQKAKIIFTSKRQSLIQFNSRISKKKEYNAFAVFIKGVQCLLRCSRFTTWDF